MDPEQEDNSIVCDLCKKTFKRRSALYYHIRRVHKLAVEFVNRKNKFKCPDPSCSVTFHLSTLLRNHVQDVHGVQIETCIKHFSTYDEFKAWKDAVQDETKSLYTACQNIRCDKYRRYLYACYRSGGYIPSKASGRRKLIRKKIDGWCPAGMEVKVFNEGEVHVKYWTTHFGHECEVDRLNLSHSEKLIIAKKLQEGLSFEKILDDVRESAVDGDDIKRIHLLSRRDIINISKAFKISKKETLSKDEGPNINAWVQSMEALGKDSPVIFFKKKGTEHIMLKNYDYLLVIMTKVQQKLLEACSHHVVCLDDIRITQSYNFHLVTLMTIDDFDVACPLAYGIANKVDENVISLILEIINSKVGRITTNIFMSSDIPAFYKVWQKHMGSANTHLLCTWQVDKDWRKALEKLPCSKEKRGRIYKMLKQLMIEPNFTQFRSRSEDVLKQLETDDDLIPFLDIFKTKYIKRNELWAFCFRSQQLIHYNGILEEVYKNLVECYEEGRVANSFVKPLNSIFRFSRDKILEKLQKLPNEFQNCDLGNIFQTNQEILQALAKVQDGSEKLLQVPVIEREGCYVEYNENNVCPSNCVSVCSLCTICFHKFTCTCVENFVNLNVCSHILASVNMMKEQCSHFHPEQTENPETMLINDSIAITQAELEECTRDSLLCMNAEEELEISMDIGGDKRNENPEKVFISGDIAITEGQIVECAGDSSICMNDEEESEVTIGGICDDRENFVNFGAELMGEGVRIECDKKAVDKECDREYYIEDCDKEFVAGDCLNYNKENSVSAVCDRDVLEKECINGNVEEELGTSENDAESYKSFLLHKIAFINDMLNNRTFKPEEYKTFDEYLDKIIVVSSYCNA